MKWTEESWEPLAHTLGFTNEQEMLLHLYTTQEFSIGQISKIVGYSAAAVRRRLAINGATIRARGGDNRSGKRYLKDVDDTLLFGLPIEELCTIWHVHPSTIHAEKRFRISERGKPNNELLSNMPCEVAPNLDKLLGNEGAKPEVAHGVGTALEKHGLPEVLPDKTNGRR